MALTEYTIEEFTVRHFADAIDDHADMTMKAVNTSSTEYPTGSGAASGLDITGTWTGDTGALTVAFAPATNNVFTADGNWGTIDSIKIWYEGDANDYEVPLASSAALAGNNYTLTIDDITLTFS
jgi:hypothetical protein